MEPWRLLDRPLGLCRRQSQIAVVAAGGRANGEMELETGLVRIYSPADFQKVLENDQMCDNLFELPGTAEDYGGEGWRLLGKRIRDDGVQ